LSVLSGFAEPNKDGLSALVLEYLDVSPELKALDRGKPGDFALAYFGWGVGERSFGMLGTSTLGLGGEYDCPCCTGFGGLLTTGVVLELPGTEANPSLKDESDPAPGWLPGNVEDESPKETAELSWLSSELLE
jgi:hypothetical protein